MAHIILSLRWLPVFAGVTVLLAAAPGQAGNPSYRGNSSAFGVGVYAPSYYGYNLDDGHAGYYGGGRYREYYNFGRGYGIANYPGPWPGPGVPPDYRGSLRHPDCDDPPFMPLYPGQPIPGPMHLSQLAPVPPQPTAANANLAVRVPEDAEVWFEGNKTQQTGASRSFVSPPLVPDRLYTYEIRARWKDHGKSTEQTQIIMVRPGDQISVTFPAALVGKAVLPPPEPVASAESENKE